MRYLHFVLLVVALVAAGLLPAASRAQEPGQDPPAKRPPGERPPWAWPDEDEEDPAPADAGFAEEVDVVVASYVARILDERGRPILGLTPEDLIVTVGGEEIEAAWLDWSSSKGYGSGDPGTAGAPEARPIATLEEDVLREPGESRLQPIAAEPSYAPPGKLVVVFIQIGHHMVVTLEESTIRGHQRVLPHLREMLRGLEPQDQVAVVSFDSRLKLWQDFTTDREVLAEALWEAVGFGSPEPRRSSGISLMQGFDFAAARKAANTEEALQALGQAMKPLPGVKDLVFVGWGLGRFTAGAGVLTTGSYNDAVEALQEADTTVFALDVAEADGHALGAGLAGVAAATGGTYTSTFRSTARKVREVGQALSGYYVISIDRSAFPEARGKLRIELRDRLGTVHFQPVVFR